ncbi:hypothetical protein GCM10011351_30990 [Paraliobacillus quinghaiensis]|uniref:Uncharacterized protein n=1 Tax=Paraliobacillus quinghaiensis TaxID=470815 RepID=A0A917TXE1_9BACI|nr:hypothetical protein [Paraliobacillus quinghaiensis]GGM42841.1 hypothetical protein GCM10011351_30990 [Paraliobacillus quinghaiensis]
MNEENKVSNILFYIGVFEIVLGLFLGFLNGTVRTGYSTEFVWSVFLTWFAIGFASGMLFIGFAEVIKILHNIRLSINKNYCTELVESVENEEKLESEEIERIKRIDIESQIDWELDSYDRDKIEDHYKKQNVSAVIRTPVEYACIVTFKGTKDYKIVDTGGFGVHELKDKDKINEIKEWYNKFLD